MLKRILLLILLVINITACVSKETNHGYSFYDEKLQKLYVNYSSKDDVLKIMGSPSVKSNFGNETWHYISTTKKTRNLFSSKLYDQKALSITFDNDGLVSAMENYDNDSIIKYSYNSEYTNTNGDNLGIIGQFVGNIGKFKNSKKSTE